jgi:hypothetical protein
MSFGSLTWAPAVSYRNKYGLITLTNGRISPTIFSNSEGAKAEIILVNQSSTCKYPTQGRKIPRTYY